MRWNYIHKDDLQMQPNDFAKTKRALNATTIYSYGSDKKDSSWCDAG